MGALIGSLTTCTSMMLIDPIIIYFLLLLCQACIANLQQIFLLINLVIVLVVELGRTILSFYRSEAKFIFKSSLKFST